MKHNWTMDPSIVGVCEIYSILTNVGLCQINILHN